MAIQRKFYLLGMLTGSEKIVRRIVFHFSTKFKMADESHVTLNSLNCFTYLFQGSILPCHMLIRFWCDSDITFSRGLDENLVTVLYFSIINVLCGTARDASFYPQENLVLNIILHFLAWVFHVN